MIEMKKAHKEQPEYNLQVQVCKWLRLRHSDVNFDSDTIASCKLTLYQAGRNKKIQKEGFKRPDLVIYKPNNKYHGLFIELKVETPYKKDGTLKKNEHLEAQQKTINDLNNLGYFACFSWSFDQTTKIINEYLMD